MSRDIPEEIIEAAVHFSKREDARVQTSALAKEIICLGKIDIKDIEGMEDLAKLHIAYSESKYQAGLLSEEEYIFIQDQAIEIYINETRLMNGFYGNVLDPIAKKMYLIEREYGLSSDEYWTKGDAPEEYQELDRQYVGVLEARLESEFQEFASKDVYKLFKNRREHFKSLSELGRESIVIKEEKPRLAKLVSIYEDESEKNESVGAYFSATIMLAAAMEARLVIQCLENREIVRKTLLRMRAGKKKLKNSPLDWSLNDLIEVCDKSGWLPDIETEDYIFQSMSKGHSLRKHRNLVHPGVHVKRAASLSIGGEQFEDSKAAYTLVPSC